jgi:hypothetical protein
MKAGVKFFLCEGCNCKPDDDDDWNRRPRKPKPKPLPLDGDDCESDVARARGLHEDKHDDDCDGGEKRTRKVKAPRKREFA